MAVTGVSNEGAFPGLVIELVAVVRVDVHIVGATKDTELGHVSFLVGDGAVGDTVAATVPYTVADVNNCEEGIFLEGSAKVGFIEECLRCLSKCAPLALHTSKLVMSIGGCSFHMNGVLLADVHELMSQELRNTASLSIRTILMQCPRALALMTKFSKASGESDLSLSSSAKTIPVV